MSENLGRRAQIIFKALVERYIREGTPVGSKTLAEDANLPLSPATIRNVLADLEDNGLLRAPHTSAGRVPTARGYRLFVDSLLTLQPLNAKTMLKVRQQLAPEKDTANLLAAASSLLSSITSLTGLVTIPKQKHQSFSHVEFLPLSGNRLLVILVLNGTEVQNRIIHTHRAYTIEELQQASQFLNTQFAGFDLSQLKQQLQKKMKHDKQTINQLLQAAIELQPNQNNDFVMSGQARLFDFTEPQDVSKLRELFEAFTQKRDILYLLDQCLEANGVQIYIGEESGYELFDDYTLVTAPYSADGKIVGVLAVIGPTRMAYDKVIPVVDITAKLLSAALNQEK